MMLCLQMMRTSTSLMFFGPVMVPLQSEANDGNPEIVANDGNELVYDDPVVIYRRSHSLVGPSVCVSQSLKLIMLTLHETAHSDELSYCVNGGTIEEILESFTDEDVKDVEIDDSSKVGRVGLEDFVVMKVVGKGAFGKVFQVRKKGTTEIYAMKVMRKDKIMEHNHAEYMKAERDILTKIDHPFILRLRYSFQTKYRLYLVLDFINGGHLFFQLYNHGLFREELARIYTADILSALSHLHTNGIMHRDLKPENILLDADGHVVLIDFGLAKEFEENERSNSVCGTVEYMASEIVTGKGHDKAADWWTVGVLIFEMLTGKVSIIKFNYLLSYNRWRADVICVELLNEEAVYPERVYVPPYAGSNRDKIQQKIIKDKIKLPTFLTCEAHSLLKGVRQIWHEASTEGTEQAFGKWTNRNRGNKTAQVVQAHQLEEAGCKGNSTLFSPSSRWETLHCQL